MSSTLKIPKNRAVARQVSKPDENWSVPKSIAEAQALATILAQSDIVPDDYKGRPTDIFAAIAHGKSLGLDPSQSLIGIAVINGRASVYGPISWGVVKNHPAFEDMKVELINGDEETLSQPKEKWPDNFGYRVSILRIGASDWGSEVYLVGMAKNAGLWGKKGPWTAHPSAMLKNRAFHSCARMVLPEAMSGLYTDLEVADFDPLDNGNVIETEHREVPVAPPQAAAAPQPVATPQAPAPKPSTGGFSPSMARRDLPTPPAPPTTNPVQGSIYEADDKMKSMIIEGQKYYTQNPQMFTAEKCSGMLEWFRERNYAVDGDAMEAVRCFLYYTWQARARDWDFTIPIRGSVPCFDSLDAEDDENYREDINAYVKDKLEAVFPDATPNPRG